MLKKIYRNYSIVVYNDAKFDQDDGFYYQIAETPGLGDTGFHDPRGPYDDEFTALYYAKMDLDEQLDIAKIPEPYTLAEFNGH